MNWKYINKFLLLSILQLFVFQLLAGENVDSLRSLIKSGNYQQKTSAYCKLANLAADPQMAIALFDSAEYYFKKSPNDSDLIYIYGYKGMAYAQNNDLKSSAKFTHLAIKMAIHNKKTKEFATLYKTLSNVYNFYNQFDSSLCYAQKAIQAYNQLLKEGVESKKYCLSKLGASKYQAGKQFFRQGKYNLAIDYMYDALNDLKAIQDYEGQARIHNNIGNIYNFNNDYDKAYEEYQQSIKLSVHSIDPEITTIAFTNIGTIYLNRKNYDSALFFFDKSLAILINQSGSSNSIAGIYNNKGLIYKHQQQYDTSLSYFEKALAILIEIKNFPSISSTKANIGLTYISMGKYQEAKKTLLEALSFSEKNKMGETNKEIYLGLSFVYKHQKDFKNALFYYEKHVQIKDSINSIEVSKKINEYKERFEAEKKDRQIEQLVQKNKLTQLEREKQILVNKRQRLLIIFVSVLSFLLLVILFAIQRYFKLKRKADTDLLVKTDEINRQKMMDLIKGQEVKSINSYMEGQERERNRISGELHDRLGSLLSTVKLHFSSLEATLDKDEEEKESFTYALNLLDSSVEEVRQISRNLTKGVLTQFGLKGAVENLKNAINSAGKIQVKFITAGPEKHFSAEIEIELFRVIQELITNSIKHSHSNDIFVQIITDNESQSITVEDHGVGFDMKNIVSNGIGLQNLRNRIEKIGGNIHIDSAPGKGTSIMIDLAIPK
jgi:signal transduction histidine kinase